jgi:hypothetical protein
VAALKRDKLFEIARKHKAKAKSKHDAKKAIRDELIAYFNSPEGQEELRKAPRVTVEFEPNFPLQDRPIERIVDMIMQELD